MKEITAWHYAKCQPVRLCWTDGIVSGVEIVSDAPPNLWVAPGLIDLQVNGYGGGQFRRGKPGSEGVVSAAEQNQTTRCATSFLQPLTAQWLKTLQSPPHFHSLR